MGHHLKRSTRERRHDRTRQDIIDASMALIVQEGFDNLSLREIARRIDYSPAGLYEYFDGKDDLISAICDEFNHRLLMRLRAISADLPVEQYLVELGLAYIGFARSNPELFIMFFLHFPSPTTEIPQQGELEADDSFGLLLNGVRRAIESGIFPVEEQRTFEIAYSLWAQAHGMAMIEAGYLRQLNFDFAVADRRAIEALIAGLRSQKAASL